MGFYFDSSKEISSEVAEVLLNENCTDGGGNASH